MRRNYDAPALGPQGSDVLLLADQSFYLNFPPLPKCPKGAVAPEMWRTCKTRSPTFLGGTKL